MTQKNKVRIGCVQYKQSRISSYQEFEGKLRYFAEVIADYEGDFLVYPELFTLQLLSMASNKLPADKAIDELTRYTPQIKSTLVDLAKEYKVNIIGGSHPTRTNSGRIENLCYVALRDGTLHEQPKIHATPSEARCWGIEGGDYLNAIQTDCGPIGINICYDSEFPELARHLIAQGAEILFVPFCTDDRHGYLRVRYSSQARAIENQVYVALAGNCGHLPGVYNMDIQYAQSAIFTPCDTPFARDGIAAIADSNVEMLVMADLDMEALRKARKNGTVQNLNDRRLDLYNVDWKGN